MPLHTIRRYTELVKQGDGNERQRVALLHQHEQTVNDQIAQLQRCLDMIKYKLGCYDEILAQQDGQATT